MQSIIRSLPKKPGIYQYLDRSGRLLYVGKAKNLKNRVKSYWRLTPELTPNPILSQRLQKMLGEVTSLEYILVDSEEDALILENSLIKQLKPKYNILLRDDKTYPYITINYSEDFPRFEITRKIIKGKNIKYYGPFPSGAKVLLDSLYELYPLVQKKSCIKGGKACLFYQIGKCLAPCENKIDTTTYKKIIEKATQSIEKRGILTKALNGKMALLAQQERFEEAAKMRDNAKMLNALTINSTLDLAALEDHDVITVDVDATRGVIVKLFIREGKLISSDYSYFRHSGGEIDKNEIYSQALLSSYKVTTPIIPKSILLGDEIDEIDEIATLLSKFAKKKVILKSPKIGNKTKIINLAKINAKELLSKKENNTYEQILKQIQELCSLQETPYTIEVFDTSHHQGENSVGAMIVWSEGKWVKDRYRKYKLEARDEYSQMREMLQRRVVDFGESVPPNLWLIDGGMAQINIAKEILDAARVTIDIISIAKEKLDAKAHRSKGAAKDKIYTSGEKFDLLPSDKRLQFLQLLRDEAHRFAVTYHQNTKKRAMMQGELLEKKGIGKATLKKLLLHFGSFEAIHSATFEELQEITNEKIACIIRPKT
ncbi:MAG: excinuclease ABC subunit UvrC [Campylobacterales bacterium]|nr:excinuclease ABC subunit UvrC [Campylobacterales bacterium]